LFLCFRAGFAVFSVFKITIIAPWYVKNVAGVVLKKVIFGIQIEGDRKPICKIVKVLKKEKGAYNIIF
jgi:hypothetical protein